MPTIRPTIVTAALATTTALAATATLAASLAVAPNASAGADRPTGADDRVAASARFPQRVVATRHRGIVLLAGLRVRLSDGVPTWRQVRRQLGAPRSLDRERGVCTARYDGGLELLFVTFGTPAPCAQLHLQAATITGEDWRIRVIGNRTYRVGQPRSVIPRGAKRIRDWGGGGYELATMPFAGTDDATTVLAHVARDGRLDRFSLWIGGAGD